MSSVADVTWFVPTDLLRILLCTEEVPAMDIIHISVVIVIDIVVRNLACIYPHVVRKVRVGIFHTLVANSHDDSWITRCKSPCILDIDVGTSP